MKVDVSGHGVEVPPGLRRRVETKVARTGRFLPKITEVRVVLGLERYRHLAEVTLQSKGATLHAEAAAADFQAAVDLAVAHLERQVRRRKERIRDRKPRASRRAIIPPAGEAAGAELAPSAGAEAGEGTGGPEVTIRRLEAKPMSVDEAIEQMRLRRDGFFVFTNAASRTVNVLRRRGDGRLELLQPGQR